jgi:IS5 family transposase
MVEPMIGHMKSEGRLGRNWLHGAEGDAIHAVLCGAGHNLRMILRALRLLLAAFIFIPNNPYMDAHCFAKLSIADFESR